MEEIIRPVLELSYDIRGCDCIATCRITYPGSDSAYPFDFSVLDDIPQDTTAKDRLRQCLLYRQLNELLKRCSSLDSSHERLSQEYFILQSALFASANTASALLEATNESEQLRLQVTKERAVASRLRQKLKERDLRKSGAELLLQQAESRIKELIFANGMLTKRIADVEKTVKEAEMRLERSKEGTEGLTKLVSQRDEQVKRLILRVKAQDSVIGELQEEQKRQIAATKRQKREQILDNKSVARSDSEFSQLKSQLQTKETELEILKSMLKNAHSPIRGTTLRIPKQCSIQLPQIRSTSNSKSYGKLPQRSLVNEEIVRKSGVGSLILRLNRADSNSESAILRENLSQSPFDFQQEEDYGDLPELDFRPIQEVSIEL